MRNLFAPCFLPGAEEIVFVATGSVQAPMQPSTVIVEKNKTQTFSKKEQFSSSVPHECPASVQPATRVYPTPCHAGRGLAGHPRSVRVGYGDNKTRLFTPIRSKTPAFQRRGPHLGARRERSRSTLRGDDVAGKRSHRNGSSSFERVRLLQPLLPRLQKGTGSQGAIGGPLVEEPTLVVRADSATDSSPLARAPETGSPLSGERKNMAPSTRAVGSLHLAAQREPTGLPERVLNTISEARAPSTRRFYALKWSVFSTWCLNPGENPSTSELAVVLSFLQELLDKGRSHSTLKVFVAAIAAFHAPIAGQSVGRDNLVVRFLKGARRLNPPRPLTVPTWDLPTVLRALKGPPFEPLQSTNLRSLSLKTALLLALASVKRVGDLQALSISPACLEFGPNDSKVVLKPRHGYVPKVLFNPVQSSGHHALRASSV